MKEKMTLKEYKKYIENITGVEFSDKVTLEELNQEFVDYGNYLIRMDDTTREFLNMLRN